MTQSKLLAVAVISGMMNFGCSDFFSPQQSVQTKAVEKQNQVQELPSDLAKPNEGEFSEKKLLANLGLNVFAKQAENLAAQVPAFKISLNNYCQALKSEASADLEKEEAQRDWRKVMTAFHTLEGAPFGPLVNRGRFISDYLYSWPFLNTCGIDNNVLSHANGQKLDANTLMYNLRGLAAVEYLLFEKSLVSKCNLRSNPALKAWNELPTANKQLQRCQWAQQLVSDIEVKANLLKSDWSVQGGNFTSQLVNNQVYDNEKAAINAITDALSNIEKLKDLKLGRPLGRHKDCQEDSCPQDVEHIYSGDSLMAAEAQLRGFKAVFLGSQSAGEKAFGFDDMLTKAGHGDVAQRLIAALDKAIASVRAVAKLGSLKEQIEAMDAGACRSSTMDNRQVEICSVHADVREVAFLFKTEVLVALSLRAPPTQQGDND